MRNLCSCRKLEVFLQTSTIVTFYLFIGRFFFINGSVGGFFLGGATPPGRIGRGVAAALAASCAANAASRSECSFV